MCSAWYVGALSGWVNILTVSADGELGTPKAFEHLLYSRCLFWLGPPARSSGLVVVVGVD